MMTTEATVIDRAKLMKLATLTLECEPEDATIEGNCSAIDAATDAATATWIRKQLSRGNQWAWCHVRVTASYAGFTAVDTLGCCSYESEADFRKSGDYYDDMVSSVFDELTSRLEELAGAIAVVQS